MDYSREVTIESRTLPGVRFTIERPSFGRRMELVEQIRDLGEKLEFLEAGKSLRERLDAAIVAARIDRAIVNWGVKRIEGLTIDGAAPTAGQLADECPEELFREVAAAIKAQLGLSEFERKN